MNSIDYGKIANEPTDQEKDQGYRIFECGKDGEVNELNKSIEVVLPSGRFATINSIKWGDVVEAYDQNTFFFTAKLAARTVFIDGDPLMLDHIMNMDICEFAPINEIVSKKIAQALSTKNGVS